MKFVIYVICMVMIQIDLAMYHSPKSFNDAKCNRFVAKYAQRITLYIDGSLKNLKQINIVTLGFIFIIW